MAMAALKLPEPEDLLLDYAQRLERHREGRLSVHIALSRLNLARKRLADINLAASKARDLAKFYRGEVFHLRSHDLVLMLKDVEIGHVKSTLRQIQMIFQDDPLLQENPGALIALYRIDTQYSEFLKFAKTQQLLAQKKAAGRPASSPQIERKGERAKLSFWDTVDFASMLEAQTINKIKDGGQLTKFATELSIVNDRMSDQVLKGIVTLSNDDIKPFWLARTHAHLLKNLSDVAPKIHGHLVFETSLEVVSSAEFIQFDRMWQQRENQHQQALFFFSPAEVRAWGLDYDYLEEFLIGRGYRIGLAVNDPEEESPLWQEWTKTKWVKISVQDLFGYFRKMHHRVATGEEELPSMRKDRLIVTNCISHADFVLSQEIETNYVQGSFADLVHSGLSDSQAA